MDLGQRLLDDVAVYRGELTMLKSLIFVCACLFQTVVPARADFASDFENALARGSVSDAIALAEAHMASDPSDRQAVFALGAAHFLGAVEGLGQGLYEHGLTNGQYDPQYGIPSITDLPFLRLPVPVNPAPEPFTPEVFRQILTEFEARLAFAEATLAQVPEGPVQLPLDVTRIRLDLNDNGVAEAGESLIEVIGAISGVYPESPDLTVVFDESDVPWLRGYTHLLAGITDILLAHDWTETVERTFQSAFPQSPLASSSLGQGFAERFKQYQNAAKAGECIYPHGAFDELELSRTPEQIAKIDAYDRCNALLDQFLFENVADLVAFVHLFHWPVVDAPRLVTARQHFLHMIALSRDSWALILAETDDNHEWVPSPHQKGPFTDLQITGFILTNWMDFLDEAEGVLEGRLLIPHWRFPGKGVNMRRMFEDPRTLDPVLFITGSDALPYIEDGPLAPGSTLQTGEALIFGGGLLAYFLWLN